MKDDDDDITCVRCREHEADPHSTACYPLLLCPECAILEELEQEALRDHDL